jgi:hypothetical protein
MFQPLCHVVDLIPCHSEDFRQHSLDEVMANDGALGNFPSPRSKSDDSITLYGDKSILRQSFQGEGYGGSGHE